MHSGTVKSGFVLFCSSKNSKGIETLSGNRKHSHLLWLCGQPTLARSLISNVLKWTKLLPFQVSVCVLSHSCHGTGKTDMFFSCVCPLIVCEFLFSALYLQYNSACSIFPYLTKAVPVGVNCTRLFLICHTAACFTCLPLYPLDFVAPGAFVFWVFYSLVDT